MPSIGSVSHEIDFGIWKLCLSKKYFAQCMLMLSINDWKHFQFSEKMKLTCTFPCQIPRILGCLMHIIPTGSRICSNNTEMKNIDFQQINNPNTALIISIYLCAWLTLYIWGKIQMSHPKYLWFFSGYFKRKKYF